MPLLQRDDWSVEVAHTTWAEILLFLGKCGWRPSFSSHYMLAKTYKVGDEDAISLARAGNVVLEETLKDPLAAYSTITFDMGKFAEIVESASESGFTICDPA